MRLKLLAAAVMGAAITAPACALAGQVIETYTIPTALVPYTDNFTLPSFNTSLGTLQSVEFKLNDSDTASVLIYNPTGVSQAFTDAYASIPLSVTGPGGLDLTTTITANVASGTAGLGMSSYSGLTGSNSANETFTSGLSVFEHVPVVDLSYQAVAGAGSYGGTANPGVFFSGSAEAGGTFEIIYNYASVPEPATWAFLMLGVGAIGVAMRRRQAGLALAAA